MLDKCSKGLLYLLHTRWLTSICSGRVSSNRL